MIGFDHNQNIADRAIQTVANGIAVTNQFRGFDSCSSLQLQPSRCWSARRVVDNQYFVHQVSKIIYDETDGLLFVIGRDHNADFAILKSFGTHFVLRVVVIVHRIDVEVFAFQVKRAHTLCRGRQQY